MQRSSSPGAASLDKGLDLLEAILLDEGRRSVNELAGALGLPLSTAHRLSAALVRRGYLCQGDGVRLAGPRLLALARRTSLESVLRQVAGPALRHLARRVRATVHLGVLEAGMVTYVLKESGGGAPVLTREGAQLEAYASGVGKALLSRLPAAELEDYLASGPFIALTPATLTDPEALRADIAAAAERGYARDDAEVEPGLFCLAAPVVGADGTAVCAVSISQHAEAPLPTALLQPLMTCAARIAARFGGG